MYTEMDIALLREKKGLLIDEQSKYDLMVSDYLHVVEYGGLSLPVELILDIFNGLTETLKKRREAKKKLAIIFGSKKVMYEVKGYKPRVLDFSQYQEYLGVNVWRCN